MPGDDRTPVLVGVAQLSERSASLERACEPIALLERVARDAVEDAGAGDRLLHSLDSVGIVNVLGWRATNPAAFLAERLGIRPARTLLTSELVLAVLLVASEEVADLPQGRAWIHTKTVAAIP